VALIEQPCKIGDEAWLDGLDSPIPIAADESAQGLLDISSLVGRFQVVNIKLDKCGGLTEGLAIARAARSIGLEIMVGNMLGRWGRRISSGSSGPWWTSTDRFFSSLIVIPA
jgi:L-alanine-DL-glutamate epimerase-like enolase superfamily enzyme